MNFPVKSKTTQCTCGMDTPCGACGVNIPSGVFFWLLERIEDPEGPKYAVCHDCHWSLVQKAMKEGKVKRA
jgi:hypothetical protein